MIEVNKIAIPFAKSGNKSVIYDTRQQGQAENEATWSTGFPPVTMIRKEDGGLPPTGLDFNGIFYDISSNIVFACMGGRYKFDAEYAEKIGGYPKGAILLNDKENMQYISNTDNNKTNFNTADASKLTDWSIISIADIDKLLAKKIDNADFSEALNKKANTSTNINAGDGLTGGGDLTTSRTLTLGTPSTISQNTKNSVTQSSHTHEIAKATTSQAGITQLTSTLSDREDLSATIKAVNDVNRDVVTAQKTANNAHALAQSKQDKLTFTGTGNVARMSEVNKKRDKDDYNFGSELNLVAGSKNDFINFGGKGDGYKIQVAIANNNTEGAFYFHDRVTKNSIYLPITSKAGTLALTSDISTVSQSTGSSTTSVMSQKAVTDQLNSIESGHGLGYEQSLQNVTGNRTAGVNYTNNTGKPIYMFAVGDGVTLGITIDGVKFKGGTGSNYISAIIPKGAVYSVHKGGVGSLGSGEIVSWGEIR